MTAYGYILDPVVPVVYIAAGAILLAVMTVVNYARSLPNAGRVRRGFLALLRLGSITALAVLLLRPMRDMSEPAVQSKQVFFVLVDGSKSMNTLDVDGKSRLAATQAMFDSKRGVFEEGLREHGEVEYFTFGESLTPSTHARISELATSTEAGTDLAQALASVATTAAGRNVTGVLLVSDGHDTKGGPVETAAAYLRAMKIPVYTTTVGTQTQTKDLAVSARLAQNFVFRGQPGSLDVNVSHTGYDGWYAKVQIYRNDKLTQTEQVRLTSASHQMRVPIREEERGLVRYAVKVEPMAEEADPTNNERTVFAQVVDDKAKVLFIEGEPYWDSKFLLRSLQADPDLEVTAIFAMSPKRNKLFAVTQGREDGQSAVRMPHTKDELYQYDCVFLGRGTDAIFDSAQMQLFKDYLEERGGGIVFARGKSYAQRDEVISELEPVVWDDGELARARFQLTSAGAANPIFGFGDQSPELVLRELPEMISIARVKEEKSLAVVLARTHDEGSGAELATIAYQRYGKGRVMTIGSTGLWRWAFMRKEFAHYDRIYAKFWGQMIRWIVYGSDFLPGQDISFRVDRSVYQPGEAVTLAIQTKLVDGKRYAPRIAVSGPGNAPIELAPSAEGDGGLYTASFLPEAEGEYEAVLYNNVGNPQTDRIRFAVYSDSVETRQVAANPDLMARIASETGGRALAPEEWPELPRASQAFAVDTSNRPKPVDAWDEYRFFGLIVGLLACEWLVRRRAGLL